MNPQDKKKIPEDIDPQEGLVKGRVSEESERIADQQLEQEDHATRLVLRRLMRWMLPTVVGIIGFILCAALVIWAWHFLMPDNLHWLSAAQQEKMGALLLGATTSSIVSDAIRRQAISYMGQDDK